MSQALPPLNNLPASGTHSRDDSYPYLFIAFFAACWRLLLSAVGNGQSAPTLGSQHGTAAQGRESDAGKKSPLSDRELLRIKEHMEGLPWDDLYPRLLLRAEYKIRRMVWRGVYGGLVPGGQTAHDAVQTAVEKFLAGERRWNWNRSDFDNLWGAISGVIINWGTGAENTRTSRPGNEGEEIGPPVDPPVWWIVMCKELLRFLHTKDDKVARMAEIMLGRGLSSSKELAEAMDLTQQEIDAIKKRLRRLLKKFLDDANKDGPETAE